MILDRTRGKDMHFDGLNDFFDSISNEKYIVLRNYEEYD